MARLPATAEAIAQGLRLQMLREALGKSQDQFGDIMGCAPNTVSSYEIGRTRIDILNLQRLCAELRISADWIVNGAVHSLPEHLAVKVQAAQRAAQGVVPQRRGRPRKQLPPAVVHAAEPMPQALQPPPKPRSPRTPKAPGGMLHERPAPFGENHKTTPRE